MNANTLILKNTFLFEDLSDEELRKVSHLCRKRHVPKGHVITEMGHVPENLTIVILGSVLMSLERQDGEEIPVTIVSTEQVLNVEGFYNEGEACFFAARTIENCDLMEISFTELHHLFSSDPILAEKCHRSFLKFYFNLMKTMITRLTENKIAKFF